MRGGVKQKPRFLLYELKKAMEGLFPHLPRLDPRCLEILAVSIAKIKDRDQILKVLPLCRLAMPLQVSLLFDSRDKQYK